MTRRKTKRVLSPVARARRRQKRAWTVAGISVAALIVAIGTVGRNDGPHARHPTPRPTAERPQVVSAARYASYPRVADAYRKAALVPGVLDGLYCYCDCSQHSGHYSLLECFTSDHAAQCDVCMSEGTIAYQMTMQGKRLAAIRAEVDRTFGT